MTQAMIKVGIGVVHREICTPESQEFEEFFQLFKDTAKLANDGKGMEWREMLQILPNRLQGSRLKYAKLILKQARERPKR